MNKYAVNLTKEQMTFIREAMEAIIDDQHWWIPAYAEYTNFEAAIDKAFDEALKAKQNEKNHSTAS